MYRNFPIKFTKKLYQTANDALIATYADGVTYMNVTDTSDASKASVDTGSFIPGTFRVNPYTVSSEHVDTGGSGEYLTKKSIGPYYYTYRYTGKLLAMAYSNVYMWGRPTVGSLENERVTTLMRAKGKLGSSIFSGGENLGELRETIRMLRDPLSSLRRFLTDDRERNLRLLKEVFKNRKRRNKILRISGKTVADTWLEIRYGLRPLVNSVQDLVKVILEKQQALNPDRVRTVRSSMTVIRNTAGNCSGGNSMQLLTKGKYTASHRCKVQSIVYYKQLSAVTMSRKLGLSLAFLPETAWELTRLSFVVDWFFTIGPWLSSIRYNPDFLVLGSTSSFRISSVGEITFTSFSGAETGDIVLTKSPGGPVNHTGEFFQRVINSDKEPLLPQFRGLAGLDFLRLVDGLALILQAILPKLR